MSQSLVVPCPQCKAKNRVPAQRLGEDAHCAACHGSLLNAPIAVTSDADFAVATGTGMRFLVDFWAPWCGPCRMVAPELEKLAAELAPRVRVLKVNTDEHPNLGARYRIESIPTLALFENGAEKSRVLGAMKAPQIRSRLGV